MARGSAGGADDVGARFDDLHRKLDTIAGAVVAVATSQNDLLAQGSDVDARRSQDALDVAQRLDALERQVLQLATQVPAVATPADGEAAVASKSVTELLTTTNAQREDLTLALEVLAGIAATVEKAEARADDRLAALRDAASVPIADLQALLTARTERTDNAINELLQRVDAAVAAFEAGPPEPDEPAGPDPLGSLVDQLNQRLEDLQSTIQSLSWQLPEIVQAIEALESKVDAVDVSGPVVTAAEELGGQLTQHTDTALAGALRLIDERLRGIRGVVEEASDRAIAPQGGAGMGFEAGAVMGAAQAAWNRLEQRLDAEFDDLGRQLQAMGALIEQALETAEAAANRPVVTGEQLRHTATSIKDAVVSASRSRRQRRGGTRQLPPGS